MLARKVALISLILTVAVASVSVGVAALAQDATACEGAALESAQSLGMAYVRALQAADFEVWGETLADDFEAYYSGVGFIPLDKSKAKGFHDVMVVSAPDLTTTVDSTEVSADCLTVTAHWTSNGLFYGFHGGFQPNGRVAQVSGASVAEIADGRVVREWITYDPIPLPEADG